MDLPKRINYDTLLWLGYGGMFFFVPLATSPTVICGVFVLVIWGGSGQFLHDIPRWLKSKIMAPVIMLAVLPWIGLLYTPVFGDGLSIALKAHYWLYSIAIMPLLAVRRQAALIRIFLVGLWLNSTISILQYVGIFPLKQGFAIGLLGGSSAWISFSLLLAAGILIASFYFSKARSAKIKLLCLALMAQYLFNLGFIGGRSGYIAFMVLSPIFAYNMLGQKHLTKVLIVCILATSVLFVSPVVRSRFAKASEDISQYRQGKVNTSLGQRFCMWKIALSEIRSHPFLGVGTAGFKKSWEVYKKDPSLPPTVFHPHSSFLFMWVSYGILGLIAFCWLLFVMMREGWRQRASASGFASFAFALVFTLGSLSDTEVIVFATAIALPLFAGISVAIDGHEKSIPKN